MILLQLVSSLKAITFDEAYLAEKVKDYYASNPAVYTQAGHDRWEPHYMYIGEVVDAIED